MDNLDFLNDAECVQMCMECLAANVTIPPAIERRVKQLGVWKLIVGATNDAYQYENYS